MNAGMLYGVGLGPGDPELITLRGLRLLQSAAHVFLPATAPGRSYAGTIAAPHLDPARQHVVELVCPPLRDRAALLARWQELAHTVAATLRDGRDGVFLTEGDPSLYSTFQYLRDALARHYPSLRVVVVPGVTSASAAAAAAGVPLALWDERVAIVPGTAAPGQVRAALEAFDTTVVLKPRAALSLLRDALEGGRSVASVRRAGRPEQVVAEGEDALAGLEEEYFATVIVRRAVEQGGTHKWQGEEKQGKA